MYDFESIQRVARKSYKKKFIKTFKKHKYTKAVYGLKYMDFKIEWPLCKWPFYFKIPVELQKYHLKI